MEAVGLLTRAIAVAAETGEATADRAAHSYLALIDLAAGGAARALDELLAIHARTLLHGGSFALPWIELLVANPPRDPATMVQVAVEMLGYCPDLDVQGTGMVAALANEVVPHRCWSFWWD